MGEDPRDQEHAELIEEFLQLEEWQNPEEYKIEEPYNYYGERGFIDLLIIMKGTYYLFEFKTELRDIGETIRQVKKMGKYYPKEKDLSSESIHSYLVVKDTEENRKRIWKHRNLFKDIFVALLNILEGKPCRWTGIIPFDAFEEFDTDFEYFSSIWRKRALKGNLRGEKSKKKEKKLHSLEKLVKETVYCPYCGTENFEKERYCRKCAKKLFTSLFK